MALLSATPPPTTFRLAPLEAVYPIKDALFSAIQAHRRDNGYTVRVRSGKPHRVLYDCDRSGTYDSKGKNLAIYSSRQHNNTGSKKCGYKIRVAGICQEDRAWALKIIKDTYNHRPSVALVAHLAYRIAALPLEVCAEIIRNWQAGMTNSTILLSL